MQALNYSKWFDVSRLPHTSVLLGGAFACLVLSVLVSMALLDHTQRERERLVRTIDTQTDLDELRASLRRMESGQRGYLLTGDQQFLQTYNETRAKVFDQLALMKRAVGDDPLQENNLKDLAPLVERKLDEMSESLRLYDLGQRDAAINLVRSGLGLHYMDGIRDAVQRIGKQTAERRKLQHDLARRQEQWLLGVNIVSVTLILILAAVSCSSSARPTTP